MLNVRRRQNDSVHGPYCRGRMRRPAHHLPRLWRVGGWPGERGRRIVETLDLGTRESPRHSRGASAGGSGGR
jgi:hypothetical protein